MVLAKQAVLQANQYGAAGLGFANTSSEDARLAACEHLDEALRNISRHHRVARRAHDARTGTGAERRGSGGGVEYAFPEAVAGLPRRLYFLRRGPLLGGEFCSHKRW